MGCDQGMRLLVLGGTGWLGRAVAQHAVAGGHRVTCVTRGGSGPLPHGVHPVVADRERDDAMATLVDDARAGCGGGGGGDSDGLLWDAVVDVTRQPGQVRRSVAALAPVARHYVFVSSCSVYADHSTPDGDESGALLPALDGDVMTSMDVYGEAKVACEQHVSAAFGADRCLFARAGLIAGPGDVTDRTGYWPLRFARPADPDGRVLVPDAADQPTQVVDVRDLAQWLVDVGEAATAGPFDVVGPVTSLGDHLATARSVADRVVAAGLAGGPSTDGPSTDGPSTDGPSADGPGVGGAGRPVAADPDWLVAQGVSGWSGPRSLPIWLPDPEFAGLSARTGAYARTVAGLVTRRLADTLADTLMWELTLPVDRDRKAGLSATEETRLMGRLAVRGAGDPTQEAFG